VNTLFLPFEDEVKLKEAWDLAVDVPDWFSYTVDTIGEKTDIVFTIPFDTTFALIQKNKWSRNRYMAPNIMQRIAGKYAADYIVSGRIRKFVVVKRAINTDASVSMGAEIDKRTTGQGGASLIAGLQSYTANVKMDVDFYSAKTGQAVDHLYLDSENKDGGINIWLPVQMDNAEINFHYLSRSPFGSKYFHNSVIGALMKHFSRQVHDKLVSLDAAAGEEDSAENKEYIRGKVLERVDNDIYINLGADDYLIKGDVFEVLKPDHPVTGEQGDTLGWVEIPVATVKIRLIKSSHFSQAVILEEAEQIEPNWAVRLKIERETGTKSSRNKK
jgi:hypothetical protein